MANRSNPKGRVLEDAVEAIERAILASDPEMANRTIRVHARKRIVVQDVMHEIDLWVELAGPKGYDSLFVFECKNWEDDVTKNEVIIFSEKIRAVGAQRGFIVAREFNDGARAQAKLDPRVQLLDLRKEEFDRLRAPMFPMIQINESHHAAVKLFPPEVGRRRGRQIDPAKIKLVENGQRVSFSEWLARWEAELKEERSNRWDTVRLPAGNYTLEISGRRTFAPGTCSFQGAPLDAVEVKLTIPTRIERPVFTGSIEVVGRGRVLKLEPFTVAGKTFQLNFVDLNFGDFNFGDLFDDLPENEDANGPGSGGTPAPG